MPVFFGHRTAELILDRLPSQLLTEPSSQELAHCWASEKHLSGLDLSLLEGIKPPYDVLVSSPREIRSWSKVKCHLCTQNLPLDSFCEIAPDVFVASPALCFVQRSRSLSLAQAVALGSRYCGTFALDSGSPTGIKSREPIADPESLRSYTARCVGMKHIMRARRASSLVLAGSASPMETVSQIVFCFPRRLGGFGLPLPQMNYEHTLGTGGRRLVDKGSIRIDIYWPDFDFGLEYQGKQTHTSETSLAEDIARQLAAERDGIELQMLTIEQVRDKNQRLYIAQKIAKRLGINLTVNPKLMEANQRLVDELLNDADGLVKR